MAAAAPTSTGGPAAAAAASQSPAVWCWQDNLGAWYPYENSVCAALEAKYQQVQVRGAPGGRQGNVALVDLGPHSPALKSYLVDVMNMFQMNKYSNVKRRVARFDGTFNLAMPLQPAHVGLSQAKNVVWEFLHRTWIPYSLVACDALETAFQTGQTLVDLSQPPAVIPYEVDLTTNMQRNMMTNFQRDVRRVPGYTATHPLLGNPAPARRTTWSTSTGPSYGLPQPAPASAAGATSTSASAAPSSVQQPVPTAGHLPSQAFPATAAARSSTSSSLACRASAPTAVGAPGTGRTSRGTTPPPSGTTPRGRAATAGSSSSPSKRSISSADSFSSQTSSRKKTKTTSIATATSMRSTAQTAAAATGMTATAATAACGGSNPALVILGGLAKFCEVVVPPPDSDDDCPICMCSLKEASTYADDDNDMVVSLCICKHTLHFMCLRQMQKASKQDGGFPCPVCKTIHGVKTGNQPAGEMKVTKSQRHHCAGHNGHGLITIEYHIPAGIQGPEHPSPGAPFSSHAFPRVCYLPASAEGEKILKMLRVAWDRRLIFTVGTSSTSGAQDTVTWNEIHHKTEYAGNGSGHGYPDDAYFSNVTGELASLGVTEADT